MLRPSNRTLRYGLSSMMWMPRSVASCNERQPALERHRDARRIVEVRDVVDELRAARALLVRGREHCGERIDVESVAVLRDFDEPNPEASKDRNRREVRRSRDDDRVAFIEQHATDEINGMFGAVRNEYLFASGGNAVGGHLLDDARAKVGQVRVEARIAASRLGNRESANGFGGEVREYGVRCVSRVEREVRRGRAGWKDCGELSRRGGLAIRSQGLVLRVVIPSEAHASARESRNRRRPEQRAWLTRDDRNPRLQRILAPLGMTTSSSLQSKLLDIS